MRKTALFFVLLCAVSVLSIAHEFWLEPSKFFYQKGETASISFRVGENFIGRPWEAEPDRVIRMQHFAGQRVDDLRKDLQATSDHSVQIQLASEGTHLIAMESDAAFIQMDGGKFTEYLREDGLDEVLYEREKMRISGDSASELYSRHTKLILQAGTGTDETWKTVCNLPLEIIPGQNPSLLRKGDRIAFKILFQGKPLFGAKVKVWNRFSNRTSVQNIFSQQDGMIETHISNRGVWMVSVVKMVPSTDRKAKYRSYWGTLVFGVR